MLGSWVLIVGGVALLSCGRAQDPGQGRPEPPAYAVSVLQLVPEPVASTIEAPGAVEAFENVQVTARVAGVVDMVRFREGARVEAGTPLVDIQRDRFRLAVIQAQATLDQAVAGRVEATRELRRSFELQANGIGSSLEVDSWRTKLAAARAGVALASSALQGSQLNLRDARVRAPISGVIQTRNVETGQYVQPSSVLATLINPDPLLLRFKVRESEASRLAPGMQVTFRVRHEPEARAAKIALVSGAAEPTSRMVPVVAEVEAAIKDVRPGTFAEVRVTVSASEAGLVIPETAVLLSERGSSGFVVEGDVARVRALSLGLHTADGRVEVLEGLNPDDLLVVRGADALRDGAKVRIIENPAGAATAPVSRRAP